MKDTTFHIEIAFDDSGGHRHKVSVSENPPSRYYYTSLPTLRIVKLYTISSGAG